MRPFLLAPAFLLLAAFLLGVIACHNAMLSSCHMQLDHTATIHWSLRSTSALQNSRHCQHPSAEAVTQQGTGDFTATKP